MNYKIVFYFITAFFLSNHLNGQEKLAAREQYDWKEYDISSTFKFDSLSCDVLKGLWISYKGSIIGNYIISYTRTDNPTILKIDSCRYKKELNNENYLPFKLVENLIIFKNDTNTSIDSAFINYLSDTKLIISVKKGEDFEKLIFNR